MPYREEVGGKRRNWKEREANVFVRRFLIPPHLSAKYDKVEEICRVFQISSEAAEIALFEQRTERVQLNSRSAAFRSLIEARRDRLACFSAIEDQSAAILYAIFQTTTDAKMLSIPVEAFRNNPLSVAILTAVGSRLLSDAYGTFKRSMGAENFGNIASLAAAISYMRPIREIGAPNSSSNDVVLMNQRCAHYAVAKLLGVRLVTFDGAFPRPDERTLFELSYLDSLVQFGADQIRDETTILSINSLPNYSSYNELNDVAWSDIHYLERLMNAIALIASDA